MIARNASPSPRCTNPTSSSSENCKKSVRPALAVRILFSLHFAPRAMRSRQRGQKLLSRRRVVPKGPEHAARHHRNPVLAYSTARYAGVRGFDDHPNAARVQDLVDGVGDLRRQPLLHLKTAGEGVDNPRELRDAYNP